MGVGAGLYVYVVVVQRSRSLSHLLMSSCDLLWHFVDIIVCWSWTVKKIVAFRDDFMCMLENYGQTWLLIRVTVCIKFCWSASRTNGMDMVYVVGTITGQWNQTRDFMLIMWCFYLGTCFPNWEICCWLHRLRFLNKNTQRWLLTALTVSCDMLLLSWQPVSQVPQGAWELQLLWYVEDSRVEGCNMCVVKSPWEALLPAAVTGLSVWLTAAISVLMKSHTSSGHVLGQMTFCWRSEMSLYCSVRLLQWDIPVSCHCHRSGERSCRDQVRCQHASSFRGETSCCARSVYNWLDILYEWNISGTFSNSISLDLLHYWTFPFLAVLDPLCRTHNIVYRVDQ